MRSFGMAGSTGDQGQVDQQGNWKINGAIEKSDCYQRWP